MSYCLRWLLLVTCLLSSTSVSPALWAHDHAEPVQSIAEMRHRNVVLQQWELSCAAAALATVLRYQHELPVTERSVALGLIDRPEYIQNPQLVRLRQGFSLLDMKRFTEQMGLRGIGLGQLTLTDLIKRAPVIVPINTHGYPHFVVFRGATPGYVLLADPAFGNVTVSRDRFREAWIDYRELGQVGFLVTRSGQPSPPGALRADISEFPLIR